MADGLPSYGFLRDDCGSSIEQEHEAVRREDHFACNQVPRFYWRADGKGRLTSIRGRLPKFLIELFRARGAHRSLAIRGCVIKRTRYMIGVSRTPVLVCIGLDRRKADRLVGSNRLALLYSVNPRVTSCGLDDLPNPTCRHRKQVYAVAERTPPTSGKLIAHGR